MAYYNNGFPATYQPVYYQQPQQQNQNGVIWVSGEQAAKSYLIAPNSTVVLFDSEAQTIYLKSADASGMPSMKVLDYTIRDSASNGVNNPVATPKVDLSDYVTKDEIKAVTEQITALKSKVDAYTKKRARLMMEDDDDE